MISNRQGGRRRGRGGGSRTPGSPSMGNRQDNRQRGNAAQLLEKYKALARDAQMGGDRVQAEYYLQFADHYFRILNEGRARYEEQRRPRDDESSDYDEDQEEGVEAESQDEGETQSEANGEDHRNGQDRSRRQPRGRRREPEAADDGDGQEERISLDSLPPSISGRQPEEEDGDKPVRARRPRRPRSESGEVAPAV